VFFGAGKAQPVGTTEPKILCIGEDATLLEGRCAVLAHGGYRATAATVSEAARQLLTQTFALVIVSERLGAEQKRLFDSLPAETRSLVLDRFILPADLLVAVEKRLKRGSQGISLVRQPKFGEGNTRASRTLPAAEERRSKRSGSGFRTQFEHPTLSRELFLSLLQGEDQAATILRQLFDEWVDTAWDASGEEHPRERRIANAKAASTLLETYVRRHPPELILGDGEHAMKFQDGASPLWGLGSRTSPTTHEDNAADVFIRFLGQKWCFEFARCRECGRRFDMKRSPARKYQFGIHCVQHQGVQSYKAAILATKRARHTRHMELLSLAVQALQSGKDSARRSSKQILEKVNEQNGDDAKRLGMTAYWIGRNREQVEGLAKSRLDPSHITGEPVGRKGLGR
jgi:hypothetical protein